MTITDKAFAEHIHPIVAEGFEINPPAFKHLSHWNHLLSYVVMAESYLKALLDYKDTNDITGDIYRRNGLFIAFLSTYAKCFNSGASQSVKLDRKKVFQDNSEAFILHNRIIELRDNYAAHHGDSGLVRSTVAVKEEPSRFVIRHLVTSSLPTNELPKFQLAIDAVDKYLVKRLNTLLDRLGEKLGKPVTLD